MKRILIVEDEAQMARLLEQALEESGYEVLTAANGALALPLAADCDAIVADVMMPVMNGFELVRRIRRGGLDVPVLFLSARGEFPDRVKGLDLGADDYLAKPFHLDELLARVRALLRREAAHKDLLQSADLLLDVRNRIARRGERELNLSDTEFRLLEQLMKHSGRPVSKRALLREVWKDPDAPNTNIVEVYVRYLRMKTEAAGEPRLIQTIRHRGYALVPVEA
ncbi:MAG: response regulator transcription factor [Fimbriimonadaceae bacterium]|nr:response regulator transcription factor [Fimbriimonadaceae bacterium]